MSEMQIKINGGHQLRFGDMISETARLFEKLVLVIRYKLGGCWSKNLMNESLETSLDIAEVHLGRSKRMYSTFEVP